MDYIIRKASVSDKSAIGPLIAASARGLSRYDYSDEQIEAAIAHIFGVDTDLIEDGTYFVAESEGGVLVGCGGWSKRRKLFGGDQFEHRESGQLDPSREPAKIRAFFVHPDWARKGIARAILGRCEREARACGFQTLELMATLPGVKLYRACGYKDSELVVYEIANVNIEFVQMMKSLS